ncbi:MAG: NAD(P)H-hydrate dehydratase [Thermoplasmata archaeon]|nr:NAD(P)H-hydrate dehydratase [Thermoplasmata archaeon]
MTAPAAPRIDSLEMAVAEENAVALGVPIDALMENAGRAIAEEAARRLSAPPSRIGILVGMGNNGGDAMAAAYYLSQWGYQAEAWLVRPATEIRSRASRRCFERIERRGMVHLRLPRPEELANLTMLVDGLLGTGQSGPLRPPYREAAALAKASGVPILSIDEPTGISDPDGLRPRWTVALTALKERMVAENSGEIIVRDIGIPADAWLRTGPGEFYFFPRSRTVREARRSARVLVIGGGPYAGAPALAGLAALRSGAERATVLTPASAALAVQSFSPNLVVRAVGADHFRPADVETIVEEIRSASPRAIVMGMGAGRDPDTVGALAAVLERLRATTPFVVDADALGAVPAAGSGSIDEPGPGLLATPNAGEYHRYFSGPSDAGLSERIEHARRSALDRRLVLVVKGDPDILTDGDRTFQNYHHHPSATVSGVGDVLGGVLGSLLAQGVPALHAARLATYWVGEAGIRAAAREGRGLVATDVIEEIPHALVGGLARIERAA